MGDVFIWRLFNQIAIRPSVWGEKGDRALVDKNLAEDVPAVLDYLEVRSAGRGLPLRRAGPGRHRAGLLLPQRRLGALPDRCRHAGRARRPGWRARSASPPFAKLAALEDGVLRTPIAEQREKLQSLGAPISADTLAAASPRRGVMPI